MPNDAAGAGTGQGTASANAGADAAAAAAAAAQAAAAGAAGAAGAGTAGAAGAAAAGAGGAAGKGFIDATTGKDQAGADAAAAAAAAAAGAGAEPYKLALPQGVGGVDQKLVEEFNQLALTQKLPKEAAQAALDWYAKTLDVRTKAEAAAFEQREKDAQKALAAHPRIGGAKYQESIAHAQEAIVTLNKAVDGLGTRAWEKLIGAGLGYDPDVAELLTTIGERMKEDSIGTPKPAGGDKPLSKAQLAAKKLPSLAAELTKAEGL